jgi:hypothetical protein
VLGKAKVMSYEDLEEARAKRVLKDSVREAKGKKKRDRNSENSPPEAEKDTADTMRRGRKRKSAELEVAKPTNNFLTSNVFESASDLVVQVDRTQIADDEIAPELWRALVARRY